MPHVPLFVSKDRKGKNQAGLYTDVIQEIDWSVVQILQSLKQLDIDSKTLVIFISDNNPWLSYRNYAASVKFLRESKGTTPLQEPYQNQFGFCIAEIYLIFK